jgi:hypothetical protein
MTGVCIPAAAVLLLLLGLASFTSSPGDEAVDGPRHVRRLQQAPSKAPKAAAGGKARNSTQVACQWDAKEHACTPTLAAWTATPGMPSSEYRRAVLMASERDKHCIQHKTAAACAKDTAMRCFRAEGEPNATDIRCASSDMEEMLLWSAKVSCCCCTWRQFSCRIGQHASTDAYRVPGVSPGLSSCLPPAPYHPLLTAAPSVAATAAGFPAKYLSHTPRHGVCWQPCTRFLGVLCFCGRAGSLQDAATVHTAGKPGVPQKPLCT